MDVARLRTRDSMGALPNARNVGTKRRPTPRTGVGPLRWPVGVLWERAQPVAVSVTGGLAGSAWAAGAVFPRPALTWARASASHIS